MAVAALVLFAVMFLVVFVGRSVIQKRRTGDSGIRAGVLGSSIGSKEWVAGWLLLIAMVSAVAAPVAELAGLSAFTDDAVIRGAGAVVAILGVALTFMAQLDMGAQWRIGIDEREQTELVDGGAFALVRNPIFTAMIVAGAGLGLMVPNAIAVVGFVLLVVAVQLQVRYVEEPHLRRLHGDAYANYSTRVGRFVPGVGRAVPGG